MLVVHPKDRTTSVLSTLYEGMDANVVSGKCSNKEMEHLLHHVSTQERIMLLGHGSDKGLFYREDDTKDEFDKIIVGHPHSFHLRKHGGNLIGIWCHADKFARAEGLHGLFSGMIISEEQEAVEYGVMAQQEILKSTDDYVIHTDFCGEYYIAFYIEDKHGNRKVIAGYDYIDK